MSKDLNIVRSLYKRSKWMEIVSIIWFFILIILLVNMYTASTVYETNYWGQIMNSYIDEQILNSYRYSIIFYVVTYFIVCLIISLISIAGINRLSKDIKNKTAYLILSGLCILLLGIVCFGILWSLAKANTLDMMSGQSGSNSQSDYNQPVRRGPMGPYGDVGVPQNSFGSKDNVYKNPYDLPPKKAE